MAIILLATLTMSGISCVGPGGASAPGPKDPDAPEEFTKTESGLRYRVLRKSDNRKPAVEDSVTVHYKGWLDDQTVFDSSYRRGKSTSFALQDVVAGWTEGLQLAGEGGMIELTIPPHLGYGEGGAGGSIPGGATLHFIVELIEVHPAPQTAASPEEEPAVSE